MFVNVDNVDNVGVFVNVDNVVGVAVVQSLEGGGCEPDVCSPSGASLLHKVSRSWSQ